MTLAVLEKNELGVRALYLGERIDLRALEGQPLAVQPLVVEAGASGAAVVFRYGVVVLFGVQAVEEASFLSHLESLVTLPFESPETDEAEVRIRPDENERAHDGVLTLGEVSLAKLQLVADILAKNVVLGHFEEALAEVFDEVEPLAAQLARGEVRIPRDRPLRQHIGRALLVQTKTVGMVETAEKPELLWDAPDLERLYARLEDEYELRERQVALERKLEVVRSTAATLLDLLQVGRSLRVEWYIVVLILIEIALTLYEMLTP